MGMTLFRGRLAALAGEGSAWASLQASRRREEKEAEESAGHQPASSEDELARQHAKVSAQLLAFTGGPK